jgi:hypothetical protein
MARSGERCIPRPPMTHWSVSAVAHPGSARLNVPIASCFRSLLEPLDKPSPSNRPMGLSDWDTALLKELYKTDPYSRSQRIEVSAHMAHDIMP